MQLQSDDHMLLYFRCITPYLGKKMFLGNKLWDGNGKTLSMSVKNSSLNDNLFEFTWVAKLNGVGKAAGLNVTLYFTATKTADFVGAGPTVGQGAFFTKEGNMVSVKSSGYGRPAAGHGRAVEIWSFSAQADSLKWLNKTVALVIIEGDDQWKDFKVTVTEWDPIEK